MFSPSRRSLGFNVRKNHTRLELVRLEDRTTPVLLPTTQNVTSTVTGLTQTETAFSPNGSSVIVWDAGAIATSRSIFAQRYAADRTPTGGPILVTNNANTNWPFSVAMDGTGRFIVAWTLYGGTSFTQDVWAARYNADGSKIGANFPVAAGGREETGPRVAANATGDFVIAYTYINNEFRLGVRFMRYAASGVRTASIDVAATGSGQSVALSNAGVLAVSYLTLTSYELRRYSATSTLFGQNTLAARTEPFSGNPVTTLAMDNAGNTVVAWSTPTGVFSRRTSNAGVMSPPTTIWSNQKLVFAEGQRSFSAPRIAMNQTLGNYVVIAQMITTRGGLEFSASAAFVTAEYSAAGSLKTRGSYRTRESFFSHSAANVGVAVSIAAVGNDFTIGFIGFPSREGPPDIPCVKRIDGRMTP